MALIRGLAVPVLAAALVILLVAVLVGPLGSPGTATEPRVTTRTVTILASAFTPMSSDTDYTHNFAAVSAVGGTATFFATPWFDNEEVTIKRITLYFYDNGPSDVCGGIGRGNPAAGEFGDMGSVCSSGASSSTRSITTTDIDPRKVVGSTGAYLFVILPSGLYLFSGARIVYSY